jgi:primase-polymerase (primpol)-like protein
MNKLDKQYQDLLQDILDNGVTKQAIGLWDMMDMAIAEELGVEVETYIDVIEKCTEEEANFIILTIMEEDVDNIEKAKEMFNKYKDE